MNADKRAARAAQIEIAAYQLLEDKGYLGTTMLGVAKAAKCSNETLYRWYGDKVGLFSTLIEGNARAARELLEEALRGAPADPRAVLDQLGPVLLSVVLSDRAAALNRAAAADPTGELGAALAREGRETIGGLLHSLLARALPADHVADGVELYLGLLIGDLQIRRVVARLPMPPEAELVRRSHLATKRWALLMALPTGG